MVVVAGAVAATMIGIAATGRARPHVSIAPTAPTAAGGSAPVSATSTPAGPTTMSVSPAAGYPQVAVHPDAFRGLGKLAYPSGGGVSILDGSGGAARSVTLTGSVESTRWSFDGAWLAVQTRSGPTGPSEQGAVFVVRADGTDLVRLPLSAFPTGLAWSPTRAVLAVVETPVASSSRTGTIAVFAAPDFTRPAGASVTEEYPGGFLTWSPDGNRLVFKTYTPRAPFVDDLWSLDEHACPGACGTARTALAVSVQSPYQGDIGYVFAGWSADGTRLLFWLDTAHSGSTMMDGPDLASIAPDGSSGALLPQMLAKPSWIATVAGTSRAVVAVGGDRVWDAHRQLDSCDLATGTCSTLVANAGPTIDPAVSPDGRRLAYVATDPVVFANAEEIPPKSSIHWTRTRRLVVSDLADRNQSVVATDGVVAPRWAGDDRHLVFWRAGYLWLVDADAPAPVAIAGPLEPRGDDDFGFGPFADSPYILPGDDVWNAAAWYR